MRRSPRRARSSAHSVSATAPGLRSTASTPRCPSSRRPVRSSPRRATPEALRSTIAAAARAHTAFASASRDEQSARAAGEALGLAVDGDLDAWTASAPGRAEPGSGARTRRGAPALDAEVRSAEAAVDAATLRIEAADREAHRTSRRDRRADDETRRDPAPRRPCGRPTGGLGCGRRASRAAREAERLRAAESALDLELTQATALHAAAQSALFSAASAANRRHGRRARIGHSDRNIPALSAARSITRRRPRIPTPSRSRTSPSRKRREMPRRRRSGSWRRHPRRCAPSRPPPPPAPTGGTSNRPRASTVTPLRRSRSHRAAVEDLTALDIQLGELVARAERLDAEREEDVRALAEAREQHALLRQRSTEAHELIVEARGGFDTVARPARRHGVEDCRSATRSSRPSRRARAGPRRSSRRRRSGTRRSQNPCSTTWTPPRGRCVRWRSRRPSIARIAQHAVQREKERAVPVRSRTAYAARGADRPGAG